MHKLVALLTALACHLMRFNELLYFSTQSAFTLLCFALLIEQTGAFSLFSLALTRHLSRA